MKPPSRRRLAPVRFELPSSRLKRPVAYRLAWTTKEKYELIRGLKSQKEKKEPEVHVQGRSQREVASYITWLRGRSAREAIQTEYQRWVQKKQDCDFRYPAPIELWTDLTCRMSESTEEAITSAFSQVLTIAATEPVTLRHSIPSKMPRDKSQQTPQKTGQPREETQTKESVGEGSGQSECQLKPPQEEDGWETLNFERIYKYLSKATKGIELPKLSTAESAVLLSLLHDLPDQILRLDCQNLGSHLRKSFTHLNSLGERRNSASSALQIKQENSTDNPPSQENVGNNQTNPQLGNTPKQRNPRVQRADQSNPSRGQAAVGNKTGHQPSQSNATGNPTSQNSDGEQPNPSWKDLNFCPLNPFSIPLNLLKEKPGFY